MAEQCPCEHRGFALFKLPSQPAKSEICGVLYHSRTRVHPFGTVDSVHTDKIKKFTGSTPYYQSWTFSSRQILLALFPVVSLVLQFQVNILFFSCNVFPFFAIFIYIFVYYLIICHHFELYLFYYYNFIMCYFIL